MEEVNQSDILKVVFFEAIERESLLLQKYRNQILSSKKNANVRELLGEFEKEALEHLNMLKDKMIKLDIQ